MFKIFKYTNVTSKDALKLLLESINIKDATIIYNEYGKPYLKDNIIYFNISHTRNIVVVALADKEVGIDIQYKCYKPNVLAKYFNEKEIVYIQNAFDKEDAFTTIWTKKEAYVKMIGQGLTYGLKNVDTMSLNIQFFKQNDLYIAICLKDS